VLIGEFAKRVGVKPDTVRFYEKVGFFSRDRAGNGYRVYTERDVETAELIATGKAMGFSLREIQVFLEEMKRGSLDHSGVQQSLKEKIALIDSRIASLEKARKLVEEQIEYCREAELRENAQLSSSG
jgi:MerR family copper efflux transcriptional regulator